MTQKEHDVTADRKILIVEDDEKIARLLDKYLSAEGFQTMVVGEGDLVVPQVRSSKPHLILLDIMLPGKDGLTIFKEIRTFSDMPVLFVTAKVNDIDRLLGLELGADDYICKPFLPREVVARVKAVLRRSYPERGEGNLVVGPIVLDTERHKVTIRDAEIHLTPNQFKLLRYLMANEGCVVTRSELISKIQGYNFDGYNRTVDNHIKNLRKKIQEYLPDQEVIRSVYGIGYSIDSPQDL
jgi:two-component system response regulator BaeR